MRRLIFGLCLLMSFFNSLLVGKIVMAGSFDAVCSQPGADKSVVCQTETGNPLVSTNGNDGIIIKAAKLISYLTGLASVIVIVIAGFRYVFSEGEAAKVSSAKNAIIYALVGLVIAASAQAIIIFVINKV